jgi:hypothetical protein
MKYIPGALKFLPKKISSATLTNSAVWEVGNLRVKPLELKCLCNKIFTSFFIVFLKSSAGMMKNDVYSLFVSHSQVIALSIF